MRVTGWCTSSPVWAKQFNLGCGRSFKALRTQLGKNNPYYCPESDEQLAQKVDLNKTVKDRLVPIASAVPICAYPVDPEAYFEANKFNDDEERLFQFTYHRDRLRKAKTYTSGKPAKPLKKLSHSADSFDEEPVDAGVDGEGRRPYDIP